MHDRLVQALTPLPVATASLALPAQAFGGSADMWRYDWGWGHMIFGSLLMILFWGGIVVVIVLLVRRLGGWGAGPPTPPPGEKSALDILKERFARGEIGTEEFEEKRKLLSE